MNNPNFDLLAIPTNQFNLQEPGSDEEIPLTLQYVRPGGGFVPDYRLAAKTECNGFTEERLFSFLKGACPGTQLVIGSTENLFFTPIKQHDITWNFEKFLISADGKPVRRYNPATSPFNIVDDIEEQLKLIKEEPKDVRKAKVLQGLAKKHNRTKH